MYNFEKTVQRNGTCAIKWDWLAQLYGSDDVLPFWVADMDFEAMPELLHALEARAAHPSYGYTMPSEHYYDQFIRWNAQRNGFTITNEEIVPVPGVLCALSFTMHTLTQPGDKVLFFTPVYDPFKHVTEGQERICVISSLLNTNSSYEIDWADFEAKLNSGIKMVILSNPHNPLGRVWQSDELKRMAEMCSAHGTLIFSDDIHSDLIFPGHSYTPIFNASVAAEDIAIVAQAPSKTFNIAGLKSSMMIIRNAKLREKVNNMLKRFHVGLDLFAYTATEAAYTHGDVWVDELCVYLHGNAQAVVSFFEDKLPRVKTYVPEGTYLMWLDFSDYALTQQQLMDKLKDEARVALNSGESYGEEGKGFVRFNIGTSREIILEGLERIRKAFA